MSVRQIIVHRASTRRAPTRRAPAIASWPRARLWLTLTREKEEQKPDSATGGCQQKHCSHGKDQHAGSSNEPLEYAYDREDGGRLRTSSVNLAVLRLPT